MLNKRRNVVSKLSIMSFLMLGLTSSSFAINNTGADSIETMIEHDRTKSVFHFPYRGEVQSFTAPMDGVYKLEAWGAEGGDNQYYWGQTVSLHGASDVQTSNNGAYAQGQYYLSKGDTIYIYVGGRGQDEMSDRGAHTNRFQNGGWNGGGNGFGAASAGGGGATDFRLNNDLESLEFTTGSAGDTRVLVAGGGGGMPATIQSSIVVQHRGPYSSSTIVYSGIPSQSMVGGNSLVRRSVTGSSTYTYASSLKSQYLVTTTTLKNKGENSTSVNYGGGGGGLNSGQSFTAQRVVQTSSSTSGVSYAFGQNVGGTSGRNTHLGGGNMTSHTELTGLNTMPHPAGGTQVGNSGHGYAKITMQNTAPAFTLSNTFRNGTSITKGEQIEVTGTIYDELGNTMSLFMQFGDNQPIEIVNKETNFTPQNFVYNFTVPEDTEHGAYDLVFWSEDDLGAISAKTTYKLVCTDYSVSAFTHEVSTKAWTNQNVTITVNPAKGYPFDYYNTHGSTTIINRGTYSPITYTATANGAFTFKGFTYEGEEIVHIVSVGNIDKVAPTVNHRILNSVSTKEDVVIEVDGIDTLSGVAKIILPNGEEVLSDTTTYTVDRNGTYLFQVLDNAGNVTSRSVTINNIDKNAPTLTITPNTTNLTNKVTLTASGVAHSNIAYIELPNGQKVYNTANRSPFTTTLEVTENGIYKFIAENNANERVEAEIEIVNIDNIAPILNLEYDNETMTNKDIVVRITASDEHGIARITMPNNTNVLNDNAMYTITTNGTYRFSVTDRAGNVTTEDIVISNINKTGPTFTSSISPSSWTNGKVQIMLNVFGGNSNITEIVLPDGETTTNTNIVYEINENGTYRFILKDDLGNENVASIVISNIDTTAPTLTTGRDLGLTAYPTGEGMVSNTGRFFFKVVDTGGSNFTLNQNNIDVFTPTGTKVPYNANDNTNGIYVNYNRLDETLNGEWTITVRDNAGNETTGTHTATLADNTPPNLSLSSYILSPTSKLITAIATDEGVAGLNYIKTPNGTLHRNTNKVDYTVTSDGEYTFEAVDNYGNIRIEKIIVGSHGSSTTELILTPHTEEWINGDILITAETINPSQEISHIILPNGSIVSGGSTNYLVNQNGVYEFIAVDILGNEFKNIAVVSNIDKEKPTVVITNNKDWTNESVDVLIEATDN